MLPTEVLDPWPIYAGDPESMQLTVRDANGAAQDLTLHYTSYRVQWRKTAESYQVMEIEVDALDAQLGILRLELTPRQTRDMGGPGVFDIEADAAGDARTILRGRTSWKQDVTR